MSGRDVERDRLIRKITEKRRKLESRGDLTFKVQRLTLPSDYNIETKSIFALPPELLKPVLASSHPKYKKKLAEQKKKASQAEAKLKTYTALRKQREEFRERLVNLIVGNKEDVDHEDIPSEEEKEMLRYYYYIKHGVDTVHVAPLDEKVLARVLNLVPRRLMVWDRTLAESIEDVKEDFLMTVKKAIIDFVLQDPQFIKSISQFESASKKELKMIGNSFRPSFNRAKMKMERNLHIVNPCIAALLDLWHRKYFDLRLIDVKELKAHDGAFGLDDFKYVARKHMEQCKKTLMSSYFRDVTEIFVLGNDKGKLPDPNNLKELTPFYNTVASIMTYQLQTLCLKSLKDYIDYITDIKVKHTH